MRYCELLELAPGLEEYTRQIPEELDGQFQLKTYPAHALIHQKDSPWSVSASCSKGPSGW